MLNLGYLHKQTSIEEVMKKLFIKILMNRKTNFYKIISIPIFFQYIHSHYIDIHDFDTAVDLNLIC